MGTMGKVCGICGGTGGGSIVGMGTQWVHKRQPGDGPGAVFVRVWRSVAFMARFTSLEDVVGFGSGMGCAGCGEAAVIWHLRWCLKLVPQTKFLSRIVVMWAVTSNHDSFGRSCASEAISTTPSPSPSSDELLDRTREPGDIVGSCNSRRFFTLSMLWCVARSMRTAG